MYGQMVVCSHEPACPGHSDRIRRGQYDVVCHRQGSISFIKCNIGKSQNIFYSKSTRPRALIFGLQHHLVALWSKGACHGAYQF